FWYKNKKSNYLDIEEDDYQALVKYLTELNLSPEYDEVQDCKLKA
ncbi:18400_t:CDS:1, partial [Dentiscutata erythropus]